MKGNTIDLIFPEAHSSLISSIFESLIRKKNIDLCLFERAKIILEANKTSSNANIGVKLNYSKKRIKRWRDRAISLFSLWIKDPPEAELVEIKILKMLKDKSRSGAPDTFSGSQICLILSVALEKPEDSGRPISFWSNREIADEVILRKIVGSISVSTIGRILRTFAVRPHKSKYWLNPKIKDKEQLEIEVNDICDLYNEAEELKTKQTKVVSIDEKTGMQATERIAPDKPMLAGSVVKIEYEYKRHGTQCLTPTFDILTGRINNYQIGATRTAIEFAEHIEKTVATLPESNWVFVMDQLNTHKSEELVVYFAEANGYKGKLGKKGKDGILKSQKTRSEFLTKKGQKLRIQYTPKHCSWLNQIEIWFGIFHRKALRRASFKSIDELVIRTESFIDYYNKEMAKPFKWTMKKMRNKALAI